MRAGVLGCYVALLLVVTIPAHATGRHISCHMTGLMWRDINTEQPYQRTLNFYLDDTGQQLVVETAQGQLPLEVRTTLYSDTDIRGEISGVITGGLTLFGMAIKGPGLILISRTRGSAVLGAEPMQTAAQVAENIHPNFLVNGPCEVVAAPAAKF